MRGKISRNSHEVLKKINTYFVTFRDYFNFGLGWLGLARLVSSRGLFSRLTHHNF